MMSHSQFGPNASANSTRVLIISAIISIRIIAISG
jgi:hypothetical protein